MDARLSSWISVAALALMLAFASSPRAFAEPHPVEAKPGINNFLTENTLSYPGRKGEENLIHFGRFGNFDWYFPCEFESGEWSLGDDQTLILTYHNNNFPPRQFKLDQHEHSITFVEPGSETITMATLLDGNHIPYF